MRSSRRFSNSAPALLAGLLAALPAWAASIDTGFLEQPWPKARTQETEVGRHAVQWRQRADKREGIFAGVQFVAPLDRQAVWDRANRYTDVGAMTPGVTAVRYVEQSERRQVIQVDVRVLWKDFTLTFELEQDPPEAVRFKMVHPAIGEYRGICRFTERTGASGTVTELLTWLKPSRPVPARLVLLVERMALLSAARRFLKACEQQRKPG